MKNAYHGDSMLFPRDVGGAEPKNKAVPDAGNRGASAADIWSMMMPGAMGMPNSFRAIVSELLVPIEAGKVPGRA